MARETLQVLQSKMLTRKGGQDVIVAVDVQEQLGEESRVVGKGSA